jgi:transcriptional regulator with XRE-family HTH domain
VEDIKPIIAKNITALRQKAKLTQIELAERLNYSDKAVSKWERAESIPDITVLKAIADMFEVPLDYLVQETHEEQVQQPEIKEEAPAFVPDRKRNRKVITILSVLLVWFIATLAYVVIDIVGIESNLHYLAFAYAVPVSILVWLVMNSVWFSQRTNYLIISLLMWTAIGSAVLTLFLMHHNIWKLVFLGVLGQVIIITWSMFQYRQKSEKKKKNTE